MMRQCGDQQPPFIIASLAGAAASRNIRIKHQQAPEMRLNAIPEHVLLDTHRTYNGQGISRLGSISVMTTL